MKTFSKLKRAVEILREENFDVAVTENDDLIFKTLHHDITRQNKRLIFAMMGFLLKRKDLTIKYLRRISKRRGETGKKRGTRTSLIVLLPYFHHVKGRA